MNISFPSEEFIEQYVESKILESGVCPISGESSDIVFRQLEVRGYGITDIAKVQFFGNFLSITVLELKNRQLKECDLSQLSRYMRGLNRVMQRYKKQFPKLRFEVLGELAGPFDPQASDFVYLLENLTDIQVFGLEMNLDSGFDSKPIEAGWFNHGEDWKCLRKQSRAIFEEWPVEVSNGTF